VEKPDLPLSKKACFGKVYEKSVLLEVILNNDGSVLGFEKRTLNLLFSSKVHAKKYTGTGHIRGLLQYASKQGGMIKVSEKSPELDGADVDLVIYASPDVPLAGLCKLMQVACEENIKIYRYHIGVKDEETGKNGILSYCPPMDIGLPDGDSGEEGKPDRYEVMIWTHSTESAYSIVSTNKEEKTYKSLDELEKALDDIKKRSPDAEITMGIGGVPLHLRSPEKPAVTVKDLVDVMTLLVSKGAELTKPRIDEIEMIEEIIEEIEPARYDE